MSYDRLSARRLRRGPPRLVTEVLSVDVQRPDEDGSPLPLPGTDEPGEPEDER